MSSHSSQGYEKNLSSKTQRYRGAVQQRPEHQSPSSDRRPDALRRLAGGIDQIGAPKVLLKYGETLIEAASKEPSTELAVKDLDKARQTFERTIRSQEQYNPGSVMAETVKARIQLAYMPAYESQAIYGRLPEPTQQESIYFNLLAIFDDMDGNFEADSPYHNANDRKDFMGVTYELIALTLLERYALMNHPDASWHPQPALIVENNFSTSLSSPVNRNWDITVFTQLDPEEMYEHGYKIQIKNRLNHQYSQKYSSDISVVHMREDVMTSADNRIFGIGGFRALLEMEQTEQDPFKQDFATKQLNAMQNRLLEAIDR